MKYRWIYTLLMLAAVSGAAQAACTEHTSYTGAADTWNNLTSYVLHMPTAPVASANDVCVAAFGSARPATQTFTPPAGWTQQYCSGGASGNMQVCFFTYVATGTDPATFTWTGAVADFGGGEIECASGCNTSSPVDSGTTVTNSCNSGGVAALDCVVPAATLANAGDLVIAAASDDDSVGACGSSNTFTTPAGYTARTTCAAGGIAPGVSFSYFATWDQAFAASGSTGTFVSDWSNSSFPVAEGMIALAPATAAVPSASLGGSAQIKGPSQLQ